MRSYVINLDRSQDRLTKMKTQFDAYGMSFERVAAVDGYTYDGKYLEASFCTIENHPITKFEIACFVSHRLCWERIAEGSEPYGAVFEDDVILSKEAFPLLKDGADWLSKVDVVKIETYNGDVFFHRKSLKASEAFRLHKAHSFHSGSGGYIISKQAAHYLLDLTEQMLPCSVDHFLFNRVCLPSQSQRILQLVPAVCIQARRMDGAEFEESTIDLNGRNRDVTPRKRKSAWEKVAQLFKQPAKRLYFKKMTIPFLKM